MACAHLATSLASLGEFDRALAHADRARMVADRLEHPAGRTLADVWRAGVLVQRGEYAEALTAAERAVEMAQEHQLMLWLPRACVVRGRGLVGVGELARGLASIEQAVAMAESVGRTVVTSAFLSALAEALLAHGRHDDARQAAETAFAVATAAGELTNEAQALFLCAEARSGGSAPAYGVALDLYERARHRGGHRAPSAPRAL